MRVRQTTCFSLQPFVKLGAISCQHRPRRKAAPDQRITTQKTQTRGQCGGSLLKSSSRRVGPAVLRRTWRKGHRALAGLLRLETWQPERYQLRLRHWRSEVSGHPRSGASNATAHDLRRRVLAPRHPRGLWHFAGPTARRRQPRPSTTSREIIVFRDASVRSIKHACM